MVEVHQEGQTVADKNDKTRTDGAPDAEEQPKRDINAKSGFLSWLRNRGKTGAGTDTGDDDADGAKRQSDIQLEIRRISAMDFDGMTPDKRKMYERRLRKLVKRAAKEEDEAYDADSKYRGRVRGRRTLSDTDGAKVPWWKRKFVAIPAAIVGGVIIALPLVSPIISGIGTDLSRGYELTGGIAATVGDTNISEDTITESIMSTKQYYETDEEWAQHLADSNLTPESLREQTLGSYIDDAMMQLAYEDQDITVDADDLQAAWDDTVDTYYSGDESAMVEMVEASGYTESTYKQSVLSSSARRQKLKDKVAPKDDVTDQDVLDYMNDNAETYDHGRRSSHILVKFEYDDEGNVTDEAKEEARERAQEALDKIKSGELSFEEAVEEYSDDSSKDDGGDVGWDFDTTFVEQYQSALNGLGKGDMTQELVESDYGYHIIECTDLIDYGNDGTIDDIADVPEDVRESVINSIQTTQQDEDWNTWYTNFTNGISVTINEMPENVPYNVDMSLAENANANAGDATANASADETSGDDVADTNENGASE